MNDNILLTIRGGVHIVIFTVLLMISRTPLLQVSLIVLLLSDPRSFLIQVQWFSSLYKSSSTPVFLLFRTFITYVWSKHHFHVDNTEFGLLLPHSYFANTYFSFCLCLFVNRRNMSSRLEYCISKTLLIDPISSE